MNDELRRLAEAATPGPWHDQNRGIGWSVHTSERPEHETWDCPDLMDDDMLGKGVFSEGMARYIAALSPDRVLALLDRLAALEAVARQLIEEFDEDRLRVPAFTTVEEARAALAGTPNA